MQEKVLVGPAGNRHQSRRVPKLPVFPSLDRVRIQSEGAMEGIPIRLVNLDSGPCASLRHLDIVVVLRHLMAGLFGQKGARR
jgi:hypothetical protein